MRAFSLVMIVGFLALLAWSGGVSAETRMTPDLPWTTFSQAAEQSGRGGGISACATEDGSFREIFLGRLEHQGDAYLYVFAPETRRIMWFFYRGNIDGAEADAVGVGVVDAEKSDEIPPLLWMPLREAKERWPSPCRYLYPAPPARTRTRAITSQVVPTGFPAMLRDDGHAAVTAAAQGSDPEMAVTLHHLPAEAHECA